MSDPSDAVTMRETIRPDDVASVRALVAATGYFSESEADIASELVQETLAKGADSGYLFIMAERDGRLAGYACYGLIPCTIASWDLYWIAVAPDLQGAGLGRRLLQLTEERIAAAGGQACYAETSGKEQYESTRAFYRRTGYEAAAVFADFYAPGDAKHVFVKRLATEGPPAD
jgi:ribosomal protein S18 acetylase RimI-like enzyme